MIDRSPLLMTPTSPVTKAETPEIPAISIGTASARLLKNVSPPRCPEAAMSWSDMRNTMKAEISATDHLPKVVFGMK